MRWNYYNLRQLSLLQSAMDSYYKLRQLFYYKVRHGLFQIVTGITKCDDYYKLRQYNVYYADHGFLRSISRKRLTSFIFKVSGRPLGGVSAMVLNNILATATHTAAQKQYGGGTHPPNSLRYRTSPTSKQQQKTRQLHKKERKPEAVQKKKTQRRRQDKL